MDSSNRQFDRRLQRSALGKPPSEPSYCLSFGFLALLSLKLVLFVRSHLHMSQHDDTLITLPHPTANPWWTPLYITNSCSMPLSLVLAVLALRISSVCFAFSGDICPSNSEAAHEYGSLIFSISWGNVSIDGCAVKPHTVNGEPSSALNSSLQSFVTHRPPQQNLVSRVRIRFPTKSKIPTRRCQLADLWPRSSSDFGGSL